MFSTTLMLNNPELRLSHVIIYLNQNTPNVYLFIRHLFYMWSRRTLSKTNAMGTLCHGARSRLFGGLSIHFNSASCLCIEARKPAHVRSDIHHVVDTSHARRIVRTYTDHADTLFVDILVGMLAGITSNRVRLIAAAIRGRLRLKTN